MLAARNEAHRQPSLYFQIARTSLQAGDPETPPRTWQTVMEEMSKTRISSTNSRYESAAKDAAFDLLRDVVVIETNALHFPDVLEAGTVFTNVFLRRYHNFALGMNWLPCPILPPEAMDSGDLSREEGNHMEEHQRIVQREPNESSRPFYELCWHTGGSRLLPSWELRDAAKEVDMRNDETVLDQRIGDRQASKSVETSNSEFRLRAISSRTFRTSGLAVFLLS